MKYENTESFTISKKILLIQKISKCLNKKTLKKYIYLNKINRENKGFSSTSWQVPLAVLFTVTTYAFHCLLTCTKCFPWALPGLSLLGLFALTFMDLYGLYGQVATLQLMPAFAVRTDSSQTLSSKICFERRNRKDKSLRIMETDLWQRA